MKVIIVVEVVPIVAIIKAALTNLLAIGATDDRITAPTADNAGALGRIKVILFAIHLSFLAKFSFLVLAQLVLQLLDQPRLAAGIAEGAAMGDAGDVDHAARSFSSLRRPCHDFLFRRDAAGFRTLKQYNKVQLSGKHFFPFLNRFGSSRRADCLEDTASYDIME